MRRSSVLRFISDGFLSDGIPSVTSFPSSNKNSAILSDARLTLEMSIILLRLIRGKTILFMFAGINMFWARLRLILARAVYYYYYHFGGH